MRNGDGGELMQCSCGASTVGQKATYRGTHLHFECCGGCGRCGCWALMRDGRLLAIGECAQERFEALRASGSRPVPARAEDSDLLRAMLEALGDE